MKKRLISIFLALIIFFAAVQMGDVSVSAAEGYSIKVNYQTNTVTIYYNGEPVRGCLCSTGTWTPKSGTYRMSSKYRWAMLKGNVWGQYCTVITGNIWFHSVPYVSKSPSDLEYWEYDKLGTTCSAGCVRLAVRDVKWIYENCPSGTPVTFYASSDPGPYGKPEALKISSAPDPYNKWDPTDPDEDNPWNKDTVYMQHAFNTSEYVKYNPNLNSVVESTQGSETQVLKVHWMTIGIRASLRASELYEMNTYKSNYPELVEQFGNDNYQYVYHFNENGYDEGRIANLSLLPFRNSFIFDAEYYAAAYPDLARAFGNDKNKLLKHFIYYGLREGRQASPAFDISFYKNKYADLRNAFGNDNLKYVAHFVNYGLREGRQASMVFDVNFYKNKYADLRNAFGNDNIKYAEHYMKYGLKEGRQSSQVFDMAYYKAKYADLNKAFGGDNKKYAFHFQKYGINEARRASREFDISIYKYTNTDLQKAFGNENAKYAAHFMSSGTREGRPGAFTDEELGKVFDCRFYADKYPDLKKAFGYNEAKLLNHYLKYGIKEGRQASANFSVNAYKKRYADLRNAFGNDNSKYVRHFVKYGAREGRNGR